MSQIKSIPEKLYNNGFLFRQAHQFFHKTFHTIKFSNFIDIELSVLFNKPILNLEKFDQWLHNQFGEYENIGMSMEDLLIANYGRVAAIQIKELLA